MESKLIKKQRGFLLIVAVILIAVVAVIGLFLDYMFIGSIISSTNVVQSDQSFYIATSGLEMAKRDMLKNNFTCAQINGKYNAAQSLFQGHVTSPKVNGQFTVTCTPKPSAALTSSINATATLIYMPAALVPLLPASGAISIDNEIMTYSGYSGNPMTVVRGASGTTAAAHSSGSIVNNNAYTLTAIGGVPTIASPEGMRSLRQDLFVGAGSGGGLGSLPGGIAPSLTIGAATGASGNPSFYMPSGTVNIYNPSCTAGSGCTIATPGGAAFNGTFNSYTNGSLNSYCSGSCTQDGPTGNNPGDINSDVLANYSGTNGISTNSSTFYSYFFDSSLSTMISGATLTNSIALYNNPTQSGVYYINGNVTAPNGVSGFQAFASATAPSTLIINGNLTLTSGTDRIGSTLGPVTLIVNGNVTLASDVIINGFVYANGSTVLTNSTTINGAFASAGPVIASGNTLINFNSTILQALGMMGGTVKVVSTPEVF